MGITSQIMREALEQAQRGRLYILDKMEGTITTGREKISAFAPRIYTLQIPVDKIRDLIGPGGKMIRSIIEANRREDRRRRYRQSERCVERRAVGARRDADASTTSRRCRKSARRIWAKWCGWLSSARSSKSFPGTDGLLHISEIAEHRVKEVRDELKEGDQVLVKVLGIEGNRIKLTRKAILREQRAKMGAAAGRRR